VQVARMNGVNESDSFKAPCKLPALVLFKNDPETNEKQVIICESTREQMLKSATDDSFAAAMTSFINQ